jgi:hypothetical protein
MSDREKREELNGRIGRKAEAERILNSPIHKEAWSMIRADLFNKFSDTAWDQKEEREQLYREMKALRRVEKYYTSVISDGKMAEHELNMLQKVVKATKKVVNK